MRNCNFKAILLIMVLMTVLISIPGLAQDKYGGTLVFGRGGDSVNLDPINATDGESFKVTLQVYDTLVQHKPGTTEVIPALARKWDVSDDGKTWTFYLREDAYFHDGNPVNAEAVKWNFDRWRLEDNPYHKGGSFAYYPYIFQGFPGVIKEVNVVDDYTVKFILNEPQAPFLRNLAIVAFGIASPEAVEKWGEDYFKHPVGSGPFKFVEWRKDDRIILEANEDYWNGRPYLDKVILRSIPDSSARYMELQAGAIDMMNQVNPENVKSIQDNEELKLLIRPSMNVAYLAMNFAFEPFDNVKIRRAFSHAINKQELIDAFYVDLAEPAKLPLPPSVWAYNDKIKDYEYNPEKAKELLAEAGYPDGFEFDLYYMPVPRPYMPKPKLIAQTLQYYLSQVGIKANLVTYDWSTYLDKLSNKEAETFIIGWIGDNGDPDNFLFPLLDKTNSENNYKSEELHKVLVAAQTELNTEKRKELYYKAQEIIHEDAPFVPLVHSTDPLALKNKVMNYIPNPTITETFHKVWLQNK